MPQQVVFPPSNILLQRFRALECGYFTKEQIDDADPTVMIALPRIAIVW